MTRKWSWDYETVALQHEILATRTQIAQLQADPAELETALLDAQAIAAAEAALGNPNP